MAQFYDPSKRVVVQVAPFAVRVALGEAFGLQPGEDSIGRIFHRHPHARF